MRQFGTLTSNTKVGLSLGALATVVAAAGAAAWRAQSTLSDIRYSVQDVSARIAALEESTAQKLEALNIVMADRWTKTAAAEWALRVQILNPSLRIPDPRDPGVLLNGQ